MAVFPVDNWFPRLHEIAVSEALRLVRRGAFIDVEDYAGEGIAYAWRTITDASTEQPSEFWAYVRILVRRRMLRMIEKAVAQKRNAHTVSTVYVIKGIHGGEETEVPHPALARNPWPEVEDVIAFQQVARRVLREPAAYRDMAHNVAHSEASHIDQRTRRNTRQRDHQKRAAFKSRARRLLCRRFDR